jgi:hypothetical protein
MKTLILFLLSASGAFAQSIPQMEAALNKLPGNLSPNHISKVYTANKDWNLVIGDNSAPGGDGATPIYAVFHDGVVTTNSFFFDDALKALPITERTLVENQWAANYLAAYPTYQDKLKAIATLKSMTGGESGTPAMLENYLETIKPGLSQAQLLQSASKALTPYGKPTTLDSISQNGFLFAVSNLDSHATCITATRTTDGLTQVLYYGSEPFMKDDPMVNQIPAASQKVLATAYFTKLKETMGASAFDSHFQTVGLPFGPTASIVQSLISK